MSFIGLNSINFTSNGVWVCPPNVMRALVIGFGGGGGGGCACSAFSAGGGGGGGSIQQSAYVNVIPEATHTITIGVGGAGGFNGVGQDDFCGHDGYATVLANGSNVLFYAIGGGGAGANQNGAFNHGGTSWANSLGNSSLEALNASPNFPGSGGGWSGVDSANDGMMNLVGGFRGGLANFDSGTYCCGGGGAGPKGIGGDGGTSLSPNGENGGDNTGAGGGGGNTGSAKGGDGGSGFLTIIW